MFQVPFHPIIEPVAHCYSTCHVIHRKFIPCRYEIRVEHEFFFFSEWATHTRVTYSQFLRWAHFHVWFSLKPRSYDFYFLVLPEHYDWVWGVLLMMYYKFYNTTTITWKGKSYSIKNNEMTERWNHITLFETPCMNVYVYVSVYVCLYEDEERRVCLCHNLRVI